MIDRELKRSLGQMIKGVQVIGAADGDTRRLYTSHWFSQVAFDEPIVLASVSPKHDTHPLIASTGRFSASLLAAVPMIERRQPTALDPIAAGWHGQESGQSICRTRNRCQR